MIFFVSIRITFLGLLFVSLSILTGCGSGGTLPKLLQPPAPVAQNIHFTGPISMDWSQATLPLSNLIASSSCPPEAVTVVVDTVDPDKRVGSGNSLASWSRDTSNRSYGTIKRGNTVSFNSFSTYTVTATCGSSTDQTQLIVHIPVPTITSVTPTYCKELCIVDVYGTGFMAENEVTGRYNISTSIYYEAQPCRQQYGLSFGGITWISDTHIRIYMGDYIGHLSLAVFNGPATDTGGGGQSCASNVLTVTSTASHYSAKNDVIVASDYTTVPYTYTISDYFGTPINTMYLSWDLHGVSKITADKIYTPVDYINYSGIQEFDLKTQAVIPIQIPDSGYYATLLAQTTDNTVYVLAQDANVGELGRLYELKNGTLVAVATANGYTSVETVDNRLFWVVPNMDQGTSLLYVFNSSTQKVEAITQINSVVDTLLATPPGMLLAYHVGSSQVTYIDPQSFQPGPTTNLPFGLLLSQQDPVRLPDGTLMKAVGTTNGTIVSITGGLSYGQLAITATTLASVKAPEQLYEGFALAYASGKVVVVSDQ